MKTSNEQPCNEQQFFMHLIESPLAKPDIAPEELAIWLDLEGYSNVKAFIKILNAIDWWYHRQLDCKERTTHSLMFFSNIALKNLFILMFKTSYCDKIVLSKGLRNFATRKMKNYRDMMMHTYRVMHASDKYEIFTELVDLIDDKVKNVNSKRNEFLEVQ